MESLELHNGQKQIWFSLQETDMEAEFLSLGMDIIGLGVFNYDFRSLTTESPVIKVTHPCPVHLLSLHSCKTTKSFCCILRASLGASRKQQVV